MSRILLALTLLAGPACADPPEGEQARQERVQEMYEDYRREAFSEVPEVDVAGYRALPEGDRVLVDVRTDEEQAVSRIPGAVPRDEFEAHPERYQGRTVVTYCTIGYRSGEYAEELQQQGWDARNLAGSILAWTHAEGELVTPEGEPTKRVHVYGAQWNLAADGYETVW